jgi:cyclopropane fatty-acyl-phospholipid synthase-like methyltransferase
LGGTLVDLKDLLAMTKMMPDNEKIQDDSSVCAVCGIPLSGPVMVHFGGARLIRCTTCGSWIYLPRPSAQEQVAIHDSADYFEHPYFQGRRRAKATLDRRCRETFARIGTEVNLESLRGERLLDVGCDTGSFLASAAEQFGIVPVGIDVSSHAVQEATKKGIETYHTNLETAPSHLKDFTVITAIDLIEHVAEPRAFLQQIFVRLRPGGVAYLETPNVRSMVYLAGRILCSVTGGWPRGTFERLFPPQHAQHFTCASFSALARECGFEVVQLDTRVLPFDYIHTSLPVRIGMAGLQLLDSLTCGRILICALLRRP